MTEESAELLWKRCASTATLQAWLPLGYVIPVARSHFCSEPLTLGTLSSVDRFAFRLNFAVDVVANDPDGAVMLDL